MKHLPGALLTDFEGDFVLMLEYTSDTHANVFWNLKTKWRIVVTLAEQQFFELNKQ